MTLRFILIIVVLLVTNIVSGFCMGCGFSDIDNWCDQELEETKFRKFMKKILPRKYREVKK